MSYLCNFSIILKLFQNKFIFRKNVMSEKGKKVKSETNWRQKDGKIISEYTNNHKSINGLTYLSDGLSD